MSRFKSVVPVPLGEIRALDGKLGASALPGQLVTAVQSIAAGSSTHYQSDAAALTLNAVGNAKGVMIVLEQEDLGPTKTIADQIGTGEHVGAHILTPGEEVTVILADAAAVSAGSGLYPAASGKVALCTGATGETAAMFSAIETATAGSTGDDLRILARVL